MQGVDLAFTRSGDASVAVATQQRMSVVDGRDVLERLAAWAAPSAGVDGSRLAGEYLEQAEELGFDGLLAEHRCAWAQMWEDAEVVIEGDHRDVAQDQLAARFAVFHLLAAAAPDGEAAVGARGLTGQAYEGHVFWDADIFVLPALAAIRPASASRHARVPHPPPARGPTTGRGIWPCWRPLSLGVGWRRTRRDPEPSPGTPGHQDPDRDGCARRAHRGRRGVGGRR